MHKTKLKINKEILNMDFKDIIMDNDYKKRVLKNKNNRSTTDIRQNLGLWRSNEEKEEYKRRVMEKQLP